jgi:hypothetical protein
MGEVSGQNDGALKSEERRGRGSQKLHIYSVKGWFLAIPWRESLKMRKKWRSTVRSRDMRLTVRLAPLLPLTATPRLQQHNSSYTFYQL